MKKHNASNKFSPQVSDNWALFEAMRLNASLSKNNLDQMQGLFRAFAMQVIQQQLHSDKIIAGSQVLMRFPNAEFASKSHYIEKMSKPGAWLDDAALFPALEALGYQPVIHLDNTALAPYVPFVQQESAHPPAIHLVNYGATKGGTHWECKGIPNPGNGDCGAYAVAQRLMQNYDKHIAQVPTQEIAKMQSLLGPSTHAPRSIIEPPPPSQRTSNAITKEVVAQFKKQEQIASNRRRRSAGKLEKFSNLQLLALYKKAMDRDGDYLTGRIKAIKTETGIDITNMLNSGQLDARQEVNEIVREELIHALSVDAWRDESSYAALNKLEPESFKPSSVYDVNTKPAPSSTIQPTALPQSPSAKR